MVAGAAVPRVASCGASPPPDPVIEHRPRSPSELVDAAFALLRRDYLRYCLTTAILTAPWLVVQLTLRRSLNLDPQASSPGDFVPLLWFVLASAVWIALVSAVLSQLAAAAYEETSMDPPAALRTGARRWGMVFLAMVLKYVIVIAFFTGGLLAGALIATPIAVMSRGTPSGVDALIIAVVMTLCGVLASLLPLARYAPVSSIASLERTGPVEALRRSRTLVKGRARAALGVTLLVFVLYMIIGTGANMLATAIDEQILPHVVSTVITVLVYPLVVVVNVALYYDLRIRSEGYDLELMARKLAPAAPDGAPPVPTAGA